MSAALNNQNSAPTTNVILQTLRRRATKTAVPLDKVVCIR
jgi:hypothetical protein